MLLTDNALQPTSSSDSEHVVVNGNGFFNNESSNYGTQNWFTSKAHFCKSPADQ